MHKIGETLTGTLIVEMSVERWLSLTGTDGAIESGVDAETVALSEDLVRKFREYTRALPIPVRVCHSLLRSMGSSVDTGTWIGSDFNNVAFTVRRRYVLPEDWAIAVINGWKDYDLLTVRNFGKDSLRHLKNGIAHCIEK